MVNFFKCRFFNQNPPCKVSLVGTRADFTLEAVLVEWPKNILVPMPDSFSTIIIHLDIVVVDAGPCGFTKLNRNYELYSRISPVLLIYKSTCWQTHKLLFPLNKSNLIGS